MNVLQKKEAVFAAVVELWPAQQDRICEDFFLNFKSTYSQIKVLSEEKLVMI
jgi:hypothetical protein